ncbi:hypothetical protein FOL47_007060 [Perkinsus chesapeaki]|uniref:SET domain-containing protein n=1 Tax=Perkinsus chesapeaki TaxID=330153 RepID=A0A7J6LN13_PERCH|nr:hypothetical protein FOL47_007060 [Perkinsus chesapeaki]
MMGSAHDYVATEKQFSQWASEPQNVSKIGEIRLVASELKNSRLVSALGLKPVGEKADEVSSALCPSFVVNTGIAVKETEAAGRGVVATRDLGAGTLILMGRPLVSVMDQKLLSEGLGDTEAVTAALTGKYPSLEELPPEVKNLHPLCDLQDASKWREALTDAARLNSMGFYTFPELVNSYEDHNRYLTGTAVYPVASMFNHSCTPNVSRASLGDLTWFRTTTKIKCGEDLTISYIGTDLLCEPKAVRQKHLARDFCCQCPACRSEGEDSTEIMQFSLQDRLELKMLEPIERLDQTAKLLESQDEGQRFLAKDCTYIMTERCRSFTDIGEYQAAADQWGSVLAFCQQHLPARDPYLAEVAMNYVFSQILVIATSDEKHESEIKCPIDIRNCLELAFGPFSAIKPFVIDEIRSMVCPVVGDDNTDDWVRQIIEIIES